VRLLAAALIAAIGLASCGRHALAQQFREQPLSQTHSSDPFEQMTRKSSAPKGVSGVTTYPVASRKVRQSGDLPGPAESGPIIGAEPGPSNRGGRLSGGIDADGPTHSNGLNPYSYEGASSAARTARNDGYSAPYATSHGGSGMGTFVPDNYTPGSSMLGCSSGSCGKMGCSDCLQEDCEHCCPSMCSCGACIHRTGGFAEYLNWQVRDIDMAFAVPQNGIGGAGTVPVGQVGVLDFDYESGYRVGFNVAVDCCTSITGTFTSLESTSESFLGIDAPNVIQPLVLFPGTFNAGFTAQQASAAYAVDMRLGDLDFRSVWFSSKRHHVNWVAGGRYARLDQSFQATFPFAPPDGTTTVDSNIEFEGGGIRLGLEGERAVSSRMALRVYGKAMASVLAGDFRSRYRQTNQFNGVEALTDWRDSRIVPILESEVGVSWNSCSDRVRLSAGYYFAAWSNVVTTPEYINAVQAGNYVDVGQDAEDNVAFEGLVARLEIRL
jgi:hypothetical protein